MSADLSLWVKAFGSKDMTSCAKAMKLLQSALDGELDQHTLERVNRHLVACKKCGMHARTYEAIKTSIATQGAKPLPATVIADLEEFARNLPNTELP